MQDAHFSSKEYTLHCAIAEPGEQIYVYHLSDYTVQDPKFVNEVLEDISRRLNIRDETTIVKSNNDPTQYKNKNAFFICKAQQIDLMQLLSDYLGNWSWKRVDRCHGQYWRQINGCDLTTLDKWFSDGKEMVR